MPPKQVKNAESRLLMLPPETDAPSMGPVNRRATRSTHSLISMTMGTVMRITSAQAENENSPLLKLSPEIRNIILELILCSDSPIIISEFGRHKMPGILQVNHQIREEGHLMFYHKNHFQAIATGDCPEGPLKWVAEIAGRKLDHITNFTLEYCITKKE